MNAPALPYPRRFGRTRALDGFDRVAWTVEDFKKMTETGVLDPDAPVELIEGELVPMNAKKNRHEIWKRELVWLLARALPKRLALGVEPSLYLSDVSAPEPDILVYPRTLLPEDVRGEDVLLLAEIADTSLSLDLRVKGRLYAQHGVRHYWVLDAENRRAHLHEEPGPESYGRVTVVEGDGVVTLPFEPALTIRLADLG